jgi:hypothetical protein
MAASYEYNPLNQLRSIRVLRLGSSKDITVECELIEISLDIPPKYDALSYTWGEGQPDRHILCGGKRISVTQNCEAALRTFRQPQQGSHDQISRSEFLWIDSICINQADIDEITGI